MRQAFRFKLYQHKRNRHLDRMTNVAAAAWNHAVALHRCYYRLFAKTLPKAKLQSHLARRRQTTHREWLAPNSQTLQQICDRLYLGWQAFFDGHAKRPPTFRKRRKYRSITFKQCGYKLLGRGRIKIGSRAYRFWQSQAIEGVVKTVTVSRNAPGEFFISFSCDEVWPCDPLPKTGQTAGIDRGLKDFGTLQSGERIRAPQPLKQALTEIKSLSRALSRKVKGSDGRKKARLALARAHEHVAAVRAEWHHRTARELVYRFDRITILRRPRKRILSNPSFSISSRRGEAAPLINELGIPNSKGRSISGCKAFAGEADCGDVGIYARPSFVFILIPLK